MKFGELLYTFRSLTLPKKISQANLARLIGVSRQYIDSIEKSKPGSCPPNLSNCIKIANKLNLNAKQEKELLWTAFKERIKNNWEFYIHLHPKEKQVDHKILSQTSSKIIINKKKDTQLKNV